MIRLARIDLASQQPRALTGFRTRRPVRLFLPGKGLLPD